MKEHAVLIAGGGPTGLMLAGELALAGVDVAILERRSSQELHGRKAGGLHPRTIEILDQRGIADRFIAEGQIHKTALHFLVPLDISDFPSRHTYTLGLQQRHFERILAGRVAELGVPIYRDVDVTGFEQDARGVAIQTSDGTTFRAGYLVGCDGGRSAVRKAAGIDFAGWEASTSWIMAEVAITEEPAWGFREDAIGIHAIGKTEKPGQAGVALTEPEVRTGDDPTLDDLREQLRTVYGTDFGAHSPTFVSRFTDMSRQAAEYRKGRVLLAGDAAHIHPPLGGQGLNLGVQDAMNLGWKLAEVVHGTAPESLLDTYHDERHPVGARVLRNTMAQVALRRRDDRTEALREIASELMKMDEPRRRMGAEMSGLGIHYDIGGEHPLVGRRMPDLDLVTSAGATRVYSLLHDARPVLLNFAEPGGFDIGAWAGRVTSIDGTYNGAWELPWIGVVNAPAAVLIRPDGYVAWVAKIPKVDNAENVDAGLTGALARWFGPPRDARDAG